MDYNTIYGIMVYNTIYGIKVYNTIYGITVYIMLCSYIDVNVLSFQANEGDGGADGLQSVFVDLLLFHLLVYLLWRRGGEREGERGREREREGERGREREREGDRYAFSFMYNL